MQYPSTSWRLALLVLIAACSEAADTDAPVAADASQTDTALTDTVAADTVAADTVAADTVAADTVAADSVVTDASGTDTPGDTEADATPGDGGSTDVAPAPDADEADTSPLDPLPVSITPAAPTTLDTLTAVVDGEFGTLTYAWTRDGQETGFTSQAVAPGTAKRGEHWAVVVTALNGQIGSASTQLVNATPTIVGPSLSPVLPTNGDVLTCEATATDADGDAVALMYAWTLDGAPTTGETETSLALFTLVKGDVVECRVTANDGTDSVSASATATVSATLPILDDATVSSSTTALTCPGLVCLPGAASPADVVPTGYDVRWEVNGEPSPDGFSPADGDAFRCFIRATDGTTRPDGTLAFGPETASDTLVFANTPPSIASVQILPSHPANADTLTCEVYGAVDAECPNSVSYTIEWVRFGGNALVGTGPTIMAGSGPIACRATPSDGALTGAPVTSAEVVPGTSNDKIAPYVTLSAPNGAAGPIVCVPSAPQVHGVNKAVGTEWKVNGAVVYTGSSEDQSLPSGLAHDCDRVTCQLWFMYPDKVKHLSNTAEVQLALGPDCGDGQACTIEACRPQGGCAASPISGPCNDGDTCTVGDACSAGTCQGQAVSCDDGDPCTSDACVPGSGCVHTSATGASCDDGDGCTTKDTCQGEACVGQRTCACTVDSDCDDQNPCTIDVCAAQGCTYAAAAPQTACDDGNPCTTGDGCSNGACVGLAPSCTPLSQVYIDHDADGYGVGAAVCPCATLDAAYTATVAGDCDDSDARVHPGSTEVVVGKDAACTGWASLADGTFAPISTVAQPDPKATCTPVGTPFGFRLDSVDVSYASFLDCGGYYDVDLGGTLAGLDGAPVHGHGTAAKTSEYAHFDLTVLLLTWQAFPAADFPAGMSFSGATGTLDRGPTGGELAVLTSTATTSGNCGAVHLTGGCNDVVTDACVAAVDPSCAIAGNWDAHCVALAESCPIDLAEDFTLAADATLVAEYTGGAWHRRLVGELLASVVSLILPLPIPADAPIPVYGVVGCQDPDVRTCVCSANSGCCDVRTWTPACRAIAKQSCGDPSGSRCGGLFFVGRQTLPVHEPIASAVGEHVLIMSDATAEIMLRPAGAGGTALEAAFLAYGTANLCLRPDTTSTACADGYEFSASVAAYYGGFLSGYVVGRMSTPVLPMFDGSAAMGLIATLSDLPSTEPYAVFDVFGTPTDPADDVHVTKGLSLVGYYRLPFEIPSPIQDWQSLSNSFNSVLGIWHANISPTELSLDIHGVLPFGWDFVPRNVIPGIGRFTYDNLHINGELKIKLMDFDKVVGLVKQVFEAPFRLAKYAASAASGSVSSGSVSSGSVGSGSSSGASSQSEPLALTVELVGTSKLEPLAPECHVWNRGYEPNEYGHYCKQDQPTSAVTYFDGKANACVFGIPPVVEPLLPGILTPLCSGGSCGTSCNTDVDCLQPWALTCEPTTHACACRNDPADDLYPSMAACQTACPAHPPLYGNLVTRFAVTGSGEVTLGGDAYLHGHWIEPFGFRDFALENPAVSFDLNIATYIPSFGFNGDVYHRPRKPDGTPVCAWPVDDPDCVTYSSAACDPQQPTCAAGETCQCDGASPCEVGICIPSKCLGPTWGDVGSCLTHLGFGVYFSPLTQLLFRFVLENVSIETLTSIGDSVIANVDRLLHQDGSPILGSGEVETNANEVDGRDAAAQVLTSEALGNLRAGLAEESSDPAWKTSLFSLDRVELYVSTLFSRQWELSFAPGVGAALDMSFNLPDSEPLKFKLEGRAQLYGAKMGLVLAGDLPGMPAALLGNQTMKGFALTGDPYAKVVALGDDGSASVSATNGALALGADGTGTIELWMRPTAFDEAPFGVMSLTESAQSDGVWLILVPEVSDVGPTGRARLRVHVIDGGVAHDVETEEAIVASEAWSHVAVVFNRGTAFPFVNGVQWRASRSEGAFTVPSNVGRLTAGRGCDSIDDLRLWSRARTDAELAGEAKVLPPGFAVDGTLVARYEVDFDDAAAGVLHNSRYYAGDRRDGTYLGSAQPVYQPVDVHVLLSAASSDHPTGLTWQAGAAVFKPDGDVRFGFRANGQIAPGSATGSDFLFGLYARPQAIFTFSNDRSLVLSGNGQNGVKGDFDDGVYTGIESKAGTFDASGRLELRDDTGATLKELADWHVAYGCLPTNPGCAPPDYGFSASGAITDLPLVPCSKLVPYEPRLTGAAVIGEAGFAANGTVAFVPCAAGPKTPLLEVSGALSVDRNALHATGTIDPTFLGKGLPGLDLGLPTASVDIDFDARTVCGAFDTAQGDPAAPFHCAVSFCVDFDALDSPSFDIHCGGLCTKASHCGAGKTCVAGICADPFPDDAPCYANEVCASQRCGPLAFETTLPCYDKVTKAQKACIGACYTPGAASLGQLCHAPDHCAAGGCTKVAGVLPVEICACSASDCPGQYCSPLDGKCHALKPSGTKALESACLHDAECVSGRCVNAKDGLAGLCGCNAADCTGNTFCATVDQTLAATNQCKPRQAPGAACFSDAACASGICTPVGLCGTCGPGAACPSDRYCGLGSCFSKLATGIACSTDAQCKTNKCRAVGASSVTVCAECDTSAECASDRYCDTVLKKCLTKRAGTLPCACVTAGCNPSEQCLSGICKSGLCGCSGDNDCLAAAYCDSAAQRCKVDLPALASCNRAAQCLTGHCNLPQYEDTGACAACGADKDCGSGSYCTITTAAPVCLLDLLNTTPCSRDAQCKSNHCGTVDPGLGLPSYMGCRP